jgi:hypothetical protein
MKEIYIYASLSSWIDESPEATIKGIVNNKSTNHIEILDENGFTQIINIDKLYAIVY